MGKRVSVRTITLKENEEFSLYDNETVTDIKINQNGTITVILMSFVKIV